MGGGAGEVEEGALAESVAQLLHGGGGSVETDTETGALLLFIVGSIVLVGASTGEGFNETKLFGIGEDWSSKGSVVGSFGASTGRSLKVGSFGTTKDVTEGCVDVTGSFDIADFGAGGESDPASFLDGKFGSKRNRTINLASNSISSFDGEFNLWVENIKSLQFSDSPLEFIHKSREGFCLFVVRVEDIGNSRGKETISRSLCSLEMNIRELYRKLLTLSNLSQFVSPSQPSPPSPNFRLSPPTRKKKKKKKK